MTRKVHAVPGTITSAKARSAWERMLSERKSWPRVGVEQQAEGGQQAEADGSDQRDVAKRREEAAPRSHLPQLGSGRGGRLAGDEPQRAARKARRCPRRCVFVIRSDVEKKR